MDLTLTIMRFLCRHKWIEIETWSKETGKKHETICEKCGKDKPVYKTIDVNVGEY